MADSIINGTHDFQRGSEFGGRRGWPKSLYLVEPPSLGDSDDSGGVGVTGDLSGGSSGSATPPTVTCPVRRAKYADIVTSAVRSSSIRPSVSVPLSSVVRVTGKGAPCGPTVPPPSPSPTNGGLSPTPPNPNPAPRSPFFSFSSSPTITAIPIEALTAASAAALPATKDGRSVTALKLVIDSFAEEPRGSVAPEPPQPTSAVVAPVDPKPASKASASASASSGSAMTGGAPTTGRKRASTSNADEPQRYRKRPYGHSCLACRERKIKCEEVETPPCRGCRDTNTVCEPVERIRVPRQANKDTEAVLSEFDKRIRRLESLAEANGHALALATPDVGGVDALPQHSHSHSVVFESDPILSPEEAKRELYTSRVRDEPLPNAMARPGQAQTPGGEGEEVHMDATLGRPRYDLGSAARPEYHGELSMFDDSGTRPTAPASPRFSTSPDTWTEERLRAAARLRHRYATADEAEQWLDSYFTWASPVYAVVHRPIFIRDMALDGPYFSEFLLIVIYISGIRFSAGLTERERAARGEQYVSLAMSMLADEAMGEPRIPTIQALLGLAGRQSAVGKTNQAWMLTGMAIRMMQDMGIHLPVDQNASAHKFAPEDRDMRTRLFWSAYCWDKTMSLTLGREPSLASRPGFLPDSLPDDPDDETEWTPCLPPGVLPLKGPYPARKLLKTFTLRHSSRLNLILESILTNMYSPSRPNARSLSFIRSAIDRLDQWRQQLPAEIRIEAHSLPAISPPANTVMLNLLYHTIRILIYRPLLTANSQSALASSALTHCRNASAESAAVIALWQQTFGSFNHHFLFVYCCFISAGVDILLIRTGSPFVRDEAFQRVHASLDTLEQAVSQGPGIRRGIANIRAQLDRATRGELAFPKEPAFKDMSGDAAGEPDLLAGAAGAAAAASGNPEDAALAAQAQPGDMQWLTDGDLWDHQTLMDILSAAPISTEDPFAFTESSLLSF